MTNTLFDGLFRSTNGSAPLAHLPDGRTISYDDALDVSARLANALTSMGVQIGDRVAVQVPKSIEAALLYIACARMGAVFLPLNTAYTASEVEYFLLNAGASLFICDPAKADKMADVASKAGARLETLGATSDGTVFEAALKARPAFKTVPRADDDIAAILYTSGTTGRSKGAMLSHANLLSNARTLQQLWQFTADDVLLHALPVFHTHGLFVAINVTLISGASMMFLPGFEIEKVLENLPRATTMMGVPTFYTRLLGDDRFTRELVSHMRLFISGSAPLLAETHIQFEKRTGQRILERYGMTETNMNTSNPYEGERRAGTVGFPLPGVDLRIANPDDGQTLARGEVGVIEVRGPNVFRGYWKMPEKTAEEFREEGFFITGDLGKVDDDGYVHIVGRAKDLIISGGYNIYPKEVEMVLDDEPGVLESAVIGAPHKDLGEGVVAVVVADANGVDAEKLQRSTGEKIARFKQPRHIEIIDELPRNTMGKVQKNILRDKLKDIFAN